MYDVKFTNINKNLKRIERRRTMKEKQGEKKKTVHNKFISKIKYQIEICTPRIKVMKTKTVCRGVAQRGKGA